MPPDEALLGQPVQHSHSCSVIQHENIHTAFINGGLYDAVVHQLVNVHGRHQRDFGMNEVIELVLGFRK